MSLYLIGSAQVIYSSQSVAAWKIVRVEALYLLTLVVLLLTRRLPPSREWALLGLAVVLLLDSERDLVSAR